MMDKHILFISDKKSMIADALIQRLESESFKIRHARPNVTDISRVLGEPVSDVPQIWIMYMQGTERRLKEMLLYTTEQLTESHIRFFIIGTAEEAEENLRHIPRTHIREIFHRPFNADAIIDRLTEENQKIRSMSESKRILVVDDDATTLRAIKDSLSGRYRVITANSGMNAIQMLVHAKVDLILLDYEMPVVKGPKILEMLRAETHTKDIPVMFLTSKNDKESILRVMELNPANYLLKSLPMGEILEKIDNYFEQKAR